MTYSHLRFTRAARIEDVPDGTTKLVRAGNRQVLLANWQGRIYAFESLCPHRRNPLQGAKLWDGTLECPWHHFRYDVASGANRYPSNVYPADASQLREQLHPLPTYPTEVRDGAVYVGFAKDAAAEHP